MAQVFGKELSRREVEARTGCLAQIAGIEPFTFTDGKAAGVRALRLRTGSGLDVTLVADRCFDIAEASFQGIPLCWRSPNPVASPAFYEPAGTLPFLEPGSPADIHSHSKSSGTMGRFMPSNNVVRKTPPRSDPKLHAATPASFP